MCVREPSYTRWDALSTEGAAQGMCTGQLDAQDDVRVREPSCVLVCTIDWPSQAMCTGQVNSAMGTDLVNSGHKDDGRTRTIVCAGMHYRLGLLKEMYIGVEDDGRARAILRTGMHRRLVVGKRPMCGTGLFFAFPPPTHQTCLPVSSRTSFNEKLQGIEGNQETSEAPQLEQLDLLTPSTTSKLRPFENRGKETPALNLAKPPVSKVLCAANIHGHALRSIAIRDTLGQSLSLSPKSCGGFLGLEEAAQYRGFSEAGVLDRGDAFLSPLTRSPVSHVHLSDTTQRSAARTIAIAKDPEYILSLPHWLYATIATPYPNDKQFSPSRHAPLRDQDLVQDIREATCDPLEERGIRANQFARWFCGFNELRQDGTALPEHVGNGLFALRVLDFVASRLGMPPDQTVRPRSLLPVLTGKNNKAMAELCDWPTVIPKAIKMTEKASSEPSMSSHLWPADGSSDGVSALYTNYMASRWIAEKPKNYNTVLKNFHMTAFALGWFFEGKFRIPQDRETMLTHFESLGFKDRVQKHLPFLTKSGATATNTLRLVLWGSPLFLLVPWSFEDMAFKHHQLIQASRILVLNGNELTTGKVFHWLGSERPTDLKACETAIMDTVWILAKDGKGAHSVVPDLLCRLEAIEKKSRNWFDTKTSQSVPHPFPSLTKAASIRGKNEKNVEMADHSGQLSVSWTSPHLRPSLAQVAAGTRIFEPRPNWTSMDSFGNILIKKRIDEGGMNPKSVQMESGVYPCIPHINPFLVAPSLWTIDEMGVLSELIQPSAAPILGKCKRRDEFPSDDGSAPKKVKYRDLRELYWPRPRANLFEVQTPGSELNRAKFSFNGITPSAAATIQSRTEMCMSIHAYICCALSPSTTPEDTLEGQAVIFIDILKCWYTNMKLGPGEQVESHTSVHLPDIRTWDGLLDALIVTNLVCFLDVLDRRNDEGLQHTVHCDWASSRERYSLARDTAKDLLTWFTAHYTVKLGGQNVNIEENIFQFSAMHFAAVLNYYRIQREEKQSVLERVLERMGVWISCYRLVGPTIKGFAGLLPSHWRDSVEYSVHRIPG
ncbi:hypothetical protein B0H11DRAFT_1908567 [Mycena galericulata]|nr:hypothetical protein B0H11DRAFT_1908567 [Mycena galericulata]